MQSRSAALLALALALAATAPLRAAAAVFIANSGVDHVDGTPGDGKCDTGLNPEGPVCSLRAAIQTANEDPGSDTIQLLNGVYFLSLKGAGEDAAATGDLDITSPIEIDGNGASLSFIDAKAIKDRAFDVKPGGSLILRRVTVRYGTTPKGDLDPNGSGRVSGGCIRSEGAVTLGSAFLFHCTSSGDGGGLSMLSGHALLSDSTFSMNKAKGEGGGLLLGAASTASLARVTFGANGAGVGGGMATRIVAGVTLSNMTIDHNKAKVAGGVALLGGATVTINNATVSENGNVNLDASQGAATISNSIVWGAKQSDCLGTITSAGGNLEGGTTCGFTGTDDQQGQDPLLAPLNFYGGLVPTRTLFPTSPAIDHAIDATCETTDARNRQCRPDILTPVDLGVAGTKCDVGSSEFMGTNPVTGQTCP